MVWQTEQEVLLSDNLTDEVKATAQDAIDKIVSGELEVERETVRNIKEILKM